MLLIIATSLGVLWAIFLCYELWKNRQCQHKVEKPPKWVEDIRKASIARYYRNRMMIREHFDGIMVLFKTIEPMCSYNSVDKIGTGSYRFHKIPVKGGEDDMAKGKSPVKEKKKPKKSGKKK